MDRPQQGLLPDQPIESLPAYLASGGGNGLPKALPMTRDEVTAEVTESGLRGRGGAL